MKRDSIGDQLFKNLDENSQLFFSASNEIKTHVKVLINKQVESLGLITREELDIFKASLERANQRLAKLEAEVEK